MKFSTQNFAEIIYTAMHSGWLGQLWTKPPARLIEIRLLMVIFLLQVMDQQYAASVSATMNLSAALQFPQSKKKGEQINWKAQTSQSFKIFSRFLVSTLNFFFLFLFFTCVPSVVLSV